MTSFLKSFIRIDGFLFALLLASNTSLANEHNTASQGSTPGTALTEPLVKIKVALSEMKFSIENAQEGAPLELRAGQSYKLIFENIGHTMHEVLLGRDLIKIDNETEYKENMINNIPVIVTGSSIIDGKKSIFEIVTSGIEELEIDPGLRLSLIFTVPESARGKWELGCFSPGHHESGMFLPILIQ